MLLLEDNNIPSCPVSPPLFFVSHLTGGCSGPWVWAAHLGTWEWMTHRSRSMELNRGIHRLPPWAMLYQTGADHPIELLIQEG